MGSPPIYQGGRVADLLKGLKQRRAEKEKQEKQKEQSEKLAKFREGLRLGGPGGVEGASSCGKANLFVHGSHAHVLCFLYKCS